MESAQDLKRLIEMVNGKLAADNIDSKDYDASIKCLSNCVNSKLCIEIYEEYINY